MNDNHIAYDKELEEIEVQLKELSKIYQDEYEESGKYFKPSNPKLILWFFYLPVITILVLKNQFNLISYETSLILFLIVYIFCFLLIYSNNFIYFYNQILLYGGYKMETKVQ